MHSDVSVAGDPLALPHLLPPPARHPRTVAEFAGLARTIAADRDRWVPLVRYDATTRWYARLATGPGYEVWLLSWLPGQGTGPHDHGDSSGVLTLLQGELHELVQGARGTAARVLCPGAQRVFAPGYVHEVVNDSLEGAISLHVYFPGLTRMTPHRRTPASEVLAGGVTADGTSGAVPAARLHRDRASTADVRAGSAPAAM